MFAPTGIDSSTRFELSHFLFVATMLHDLSVCGPYIQLFSSQWGRANMHPLLHQGIGLHTNLRLSTASRGLAHFFAGGNLWC